MPPGPPGSFHICLVCRWEDDNIQFAKPDYDGGANLPSLNQARENFRRLGVSNPRLAQYARPALPEEYP